MNYELNTYIGNLPVSLYIQTGFFDHENVAFPLHNHSFPECHIFLTGSAVLEYNNQNIGINAGDVFLIPADENHKYGHISSKSKRITFLINSEAEHSNFKKSTFPQFLVPLLCSEISRYYTAGYDDKLKALISFICSDFFEIKNKKLSPVMNREFIIREFFSKKYNLNVNIDQLARELNLSNKQTAREIKKYTGHTFGEELAEKRIEMANIMIKTTNMSLTEISEAVGYASYSGFYKAYRRVSKNK